jgi:ABC-2 type transport system permease protein
LLRDASFIARTDLSHLLRHREAIVWVFVMPFLFFYFVGTVTSGFGGVPGPGSAPTPLRFEAPDDAGFVADEIVARLEEQGFAVERATGSPEGDPAQRVLAVPETAGRSLTDAVLDGTRIRLVLRHRGEGPDVDFDRLRVARAVYGVVGDLAVTRVRGDRAAAETLRAVREEPRSLTLAVAPAGERQEIPGGFEQTIPGILVMFTMLVLLTSGAITLVVEREQGLLRRLASTPISRGSVVLGKWTARMGLGAVQIAFGMLVGRVVFGMEWGAALPMIAAVLLGWAACSASLAVLLANLARTPAQMAGLGLLTTMVLAALGGCWWPIEVAPAWMQQLQLLLPSGWAMDAMHQLVSFGHGPEAAVPHLAALLISAFVVGALGARTFRYQ